MQTYERDLHALLASHHEASFAWALACTRRSRPDAEDVLHLTYEKILSKAARFEGGSSFKTWIFGVIWRTAHEHARRSIFQRWRELLTGQEASSDEPVDQTLERATEAQLVLSTLRTLSPRQRQLLHLVFYEDLTIEEAAQVLRVSIGTARVHYERGKKSMAQKLRAAGFAELRETAR
jgi:RNA polymerase sigma-70 factor (ECF subfamily)